MGREIESVLLERGHETGIVIDMDSRDRFTEDNFMGIDVAIEFTTPATAFANVSRCLEWGIPVLCGTTGWNDKLPEARRLCSEKDGTFFFASNFSIGVNIFFRLNETLARMMSRFPEYGVSIRETHHIHKKDAPSGTAVTLAEGIMSNMEGKKEWVGYPTADKDKVGIESFREGEVFGNHLVEYSSAVDDIILIHDSKSRRGLALGAVLAAEFMQGRKGVLSMEDMLGL